jgi:uncharacterized membrane protein
MQGIKRKIVYVGLFEAIAILASTYGLSGMSGHGLQEAGVVAVAASAIAITWNLVFNTLFERWEARQGGLTVFLVPLMAWWFDATLWQALVMDLGLLVFFLVYAFVFNWVFDRVFGLPSSAVRQAQPA